MTKGVRSVFLAGVASTAFWTGAAFAASAGDTLISCENGRTYPLVAKAVSVAGEVVTARLYTTPRRGVPVRLIPMGAGYRYAGKGIWLDGIRSDAVLNFGKSVAVACQVTPGAPW